MINVLRQAVTLMLRDVNQTWPSGTYHVYYEGEGVVEFGFDATVFDNREKYRKILNVSLTNVLDNGVLMKIKKTNPSNPIRNMRIVQ